MLVERCEQVQQFPDLQAPGEFSLLELHTDALGQLCSLTMGIEAQHAHLTGVGPPQPHDRLYGAGLAGAVRSDDTENLARLDLERDVIDRDKIGVPLGQVANGNDWCFMPVDDRV